MEGELDRTELALLVKCKIALKSEAFFSRKKGILAMQRKEEVVKKRNYFLSSWLGLSQNPHGFLSHILRLRNISWFDFLAKKGPKADRQKNCIELWNKDKKYT